ncbi:MAG TPA: sulfatase-like hydrolase/transferase, partial [Archangium sp.]
MLLLVGCVPGGEQFRIREDSVGLASKDAFLSHRSASPARLNVVVIVADDLGIHDTSLSVTGAVKTPALERLAAGGVQLTQATVTAPICSPSRAA